MNDSLSTLCSEIKDITVRTSSMLKGLSGREELVEVVGLGVSGDITRKIDLVAEEFIVSEFKRLGLRAWVVSEEKGLWKLTANPEFIALVDPLDGSLNYYLGLPFVSVSIALYRPGSKITEPLCGVVQGVFTDTSVEIISEKVYFNGNHVKSHFGRGFDVVSIYAERPYQIELIVKKLEEKGVKVRTRTMGSAALEASFAAVGLIGHFVHVTGKLRNVDIPVALAVASKLGAEILVEPGVEELPIDRVVNIRRVFITQKNSGLKEVFDKI